MKRRLLIIATAICLPIGAETTLAITYKFVPLANRQTEVPGLPGSTFISPRGGEIRDDRILITGDSSTSMSSQFGYFAESNGTMETIVSDGQSYPGVSFDSHFGGAKITDSGVAFTYNHAGGGVFHKTAAGLSSIARIGDMRSEGVFEEFGPPTAQWSTCSSSPGYFHAKIWATGVRQD